MKHMDCRASKKVRAGPAGTWAHVSAIISSSAFLAGSASFIGHFADARSAYRGRSDRPRPERYWKP